MVVLLPTQPRSTQRGPSDALRLSGYRQNRMDYDCHYCQQHLRFPPYFPTSQYYKVPYVIPQRYLDEEYSEFYRDLKSLSRDYDRRMDIYQSTIYLIRIMAYIQARKSHGQLAVPVWYTPLKTQIFDFKDPNHLIFIAGVLLVSDVSRIVLLWTYLQSISNVIEMICQLSFPLLTLVLGFLTLTSALSPSSLLSKSVVVVLLATVIPNFVFPKQSVFITSVVDAIEMARAADRTLAKEMSLDVSMGMIQSKTHHKLLRLLTMFGSRWPLGIQDITSLPTDFQALLQYFLISYALSAFIQLVVHIVTLYFLLRLITVQ
ncbi:hypothetical protein DICVIV_08377 [Dictyocaulus viviparus]|uniref:Uncharacterized protein n=1 Tax=Dictyocaulus viviparus TaxID=29172 RepID=A0A0D8XLP9_DICVI|nr:hypothetical protein DICVIV_08377 [Dictyocaulus viviparus]